MFYRTKNCIKTALALLICVLFGVFLFAGNAVKLSKTEGERTFYLNSASSQSLIKTELILSDLTRIRGESVAFLHEQNAEELAKEIFDRYGAKILFTESAGGVTSYYGYAAGLGEPISLQGQRINLHVAVSKERCAVGTPIIFGGF